MTFRPKLVALDVDGTLVDESNIVVPRVYAAVARVLEAGVPVILSTGRSWASALTVIDQLPPLTAEHVCSNGAVTVRYPPFEVVDLLTFDPRPVIDLIHAEVQRITALPDVKEKLETLGLEPSKLSSAEFAAWIKAELPEMAQVVREEKITLEQ